MLDPPLPLLARFLTSQTVLQSAALAYPLISRTKTFKKFRSSLTTFLNLLFTSTAASQTLYDETFCQLLQSWLGSLSSSKIRAFRHTATVIALTVVQALCGVTVGVNKEFAQASRAKEAEEKKGRKDKARLKDLGKNVGKVHERKVKLEQYLTDLFAEFVFFLFHRCWVPCADHIVFSNRVFVHRYRDSDPMIRTECIKALGGWMKIHPDYWLEGNYLRYIGWVLSDDVRFSPYLCSYLKRSNTTPFDKTAQGRPSRIRQSSHRPLRKGGSHRFYATFYGSIQRSTC